MNLFKRKPKGPQYSEQERRRHGFAAWMPGKMLIAVHDWRSLPYGREEPSLFMVELAAASVADAAIRKAMRAAQAMPMGGND